MTFPPFSQVLNEYLEILQDILNKDNSHGLILFFFFDFFFLLIFIHTLHTIYNKYSQYNSTTLNDLKERKKTKNINSPSLQHLFSVQ